MPPFFKMIFGALDYIGFIENSDGEKIKFSKLSGDGVLYLQGENSNAASEINDKSITEEGGKFPTVIATPTFDSGTYTLSNGATIEIGEATPGTEEEAGHTLTFSSLTFTDKDGNTLLTSNSTFTSTRYNMYLVPKGTTIVLFEEPTYFESSTSSQSGYYIGLASTYFIAKRSNKEYYGTEYRLLYFTKSTSGASISWTSASNQQDALDAFLDGAEISIDDDPYNPSGTGQSGGGGGTGDFDDGSDTIDIPGFPSISVTDTGFVGLFTPTLAQLKSLADYMWSDLFSVDTFKKIFADPMDCILGLSIVPVAVATSATGNVKVGNISTGVSMNIAASQYVSVDCGTLNINEYWGSFLDYAPHTKAQIYLPYIGVRQIDTDEIMGRAVRIVYHVDILTGACICFITSGGSVLYTFEGACASSIPITGSNFTEMINTIVSIAGAAVATAATGGAAAPTVAAAAGQTATKVTAQIGLSTATNISNMKPTIEHSGSVAGAGALLAVQKPYLIAHRPNQCLPGNQNTFSGYPSYITATLGAQSGFTQVEYINLSGLSATESETEEIERELKSGVIV